MVGNLIIMTLAAGLSGVNAPQLPYDPPSPDSASVTQHSAPHVIGGHSPASRLFDLLSDAQSRPELIGPAVLWNDGFRVKLNLLQEDEKASVIQSFEPWIRGFAKVDYVIVRGQRLVSFSEERRSVTFSERGATRIFDYIANLLSPRDVEVAIDAAPEHVRVGLLATRLTGFEPEDQARFRTYVALTYGELDRARLMDTVLQEMLAKRLLPPADARLADRLLHENRTSDLRVQFTILVGLLQADFTNDVYQPGPGRYQEIALSSQR